MAFFLSPDGERVRVRGRYIVTLNFTKRTVAAKRGRESLYAELIQSRIIERIAKGAFIPSPTRGGLGWGAVNSFVIPGCDPESHNWTDCKGRNMFINTLPTRRGLRVEFGLFGWSENSSFSSTLRAWSAFAHASPYRKSNRSDALAGIALGGFFTND